MVSHPANITTYFTVSNNRLISGSSDAMLFVRGRGLAGVEIRWATNLVGYLHMEPNSVAAPGVAAATMTWHAIPAPA